MAMGRDEIVNTMAHAARVLHEGRWDLAEVWGDKLLEARDAVLDALEKCDKPKQLCYWDPECPRPCSAFTPAADVPQLGDEERCGYKRNEGWSWESCRCGGQWQEEPDLAPR